MTMEAATTPSHEAQSAACSCCEHPDCAPLRQRRLCSRWYFVRWLSSRTVTPLDLTKELQQCLGGRDFSIQPVAWRSGVYEAFVRVELDVTNPVSTVRPNLLPLPGSLFLTSTSRAWCLPCCWQLVKWTVPLWLACFRANESNVVFGETDLGHSLFGEIKEAAAGTGGSA